MTLGDEDESINQHVDGFVMLIKFVHEACFSAFILYIGFYV